MTITSEGDLYIRNATILPTKRSDATRHHLPYVWCLVVSSVHGAIPPIWNVYAVPITTTNDVMWSVMFELCFPSIEPA